MFIGLASGAWAGEATAARSLPRKIYGHYMGCFCAGTDAIWYHAQSGLETMDFPGEVTREKDPLKRDIVGAIQRAKNPAAFGGTYRNFALAPFGKGKLPREVAADLEIRRAMRIGMDGFTFDAWAGGQGARDLLDLMLKICEEKDYPFELTVTLDTTCLDVKDPGLKQYEGNQWVKTLKWLVDKQWCHPMKLQYENYGWLQIASPGLDWVRGDWAAAREWPSTLIQHITWNDYHENTNLSPGINTRYAYYDLTGYFTRWWKTGKPPEPDHDRVYIFSHKYTHKSKIFPFKEKTRADNVIEVLTILPKPAHLRMPGRNAEWDAPAGMSFKQVPLTAGPVVAELLRDGKVEIRLEHPEPVSDRPFRQDTGKTAICTEESRLWKEDFGDQESMYVYSEYGDADNDGLANWFEMLWPHPAAAGAANGLRAEA